MLNFLRFFVFSWIPISCTGTYLAEIKSYAASPPTLLLAHLCHPLNERDYTVPSIENRDCRYLLQPKAFFIINCYDFNMFFVKSPTLSSSKGEEGPGPQVQDGGREQVRLLPDLGSCCCAQSQQGTIRILELSCFTCCRHPIIQSNCLGF
jgi:hypothetical protein